MTELAFHFGAPDKLAYAARLVRKAVANGAKVWVVADAASIAKLDADLWALSPTDFVAHCTADAPANTQARSPVLLATAVGPLAPHTDVLVNLCALIPQNFEQFARVIEVVSTDDSDRELARSRWRRYTELGYPIARHDLSLKPASTAT